MPGRVEWSELGGDEAETVLANLLYSERRSSTRVRPSRGDFGIDVLDPSKREAGKYDVYQIKRYAKTLTASQKKEIEKSEDVPSSVELRWRSGEHQAALT